MGKKSTIKVIAYCTFDNADLVVFVRGNSIVNLEGAIRLIEGSPEVKYLHSVMGVSEKYLSVLCENKEKKPFYHLNDDIFEISMKIATDGDLGIISRIKKEMDVQIIPGKGSVTYSEVTGHENIVICIRNTDTNTFLQLLYPKGFATHQNPLYGKGIYNIETSIRIGEASLMNIACSSGDRYHQNDKKEECRGWCESEIEKYIRKMPLSLEKGDESFYAYFQALIQTLNMLSQYEKFKLSKDIFYLVFPAFKMLTEQMYAALDFMEEEPKKTQEKAASEAICQFVDAVDSVVNHIVHTDQVFLMVPGYTGTTFSIPIKLCLLYMWMLEKEKKLLNDNQGAEYQCLLSPVMESIPATGLVYPDSEEESRLIRIKVSQRSLYMPRDLMIILTHEIAHYIGNEVRCREVRLSNIIKTLAFIICEGIISKELPDQMENQQEKVIAEGFLKINNKQMYRDFVRELGSAVKQKIPDGKYHVSVIQNVLEECCTSLLTDERGVIYKNIYTIDPEMMEREKKIEQLNCICRLQNKFDDNRKGIVSTRVVSKIISELLEIYKEVFSDVAAYAILQLDVDKYEEAYRISEGRLVKGREDAPYEMRRKIIRCLTEGKIARQLSAETQGENKKETSRSVYIYKNMYAFNCTFDLLYDYAETCYRKLEKRLLEEEHEKQVQEIRDIYNMFYDQTESCESIYASIIKKIKEYTDGIEELLLKELKTQ